MLYYFAVRYLLDPLAWVLYLLIAALIVEHYGREKLYRTLVGITAVFVFALMILPLDQYAARPLENAYPRGPMPGHVDGVVILGSGFHATIFASRGVQSPNDSEPRVVAGAALARRFPDAKLVYSGNGGTTPTAKAREHAAALALFADLGIAPARVILEERSRNTAENLAFSMRIVRPKPGQTWMLVTSAIQMPRAMAIANKLGWRMTPWPSDYNSTPKPGATVRFEFPSEGLMGIDRALHEWIGLAVYRLTGRAA